MLSVQDDLDGLGTASTKNSTSVVTDSSDLVESGAVKDIVGWSGKQLMPPSTNNISTYLSGRNLTGQNNLDGTLTIDGICNGNSEIVWFPRWLTAQNLYLPIGKYIFNINRDDINLYVGTTYNGAYKAISDFALGSVEFEITSETQSDYKLEDGSVLCAVYINIKNGTVLNNEVLYPMIRKADVTDASYEPYHASVEESLEQKCDNTVIAPTENGTTASQAYAVGEHFIRDGAFCTVTQAISSGGTLTEGTNYTSGDVADILKSYFDSLGKLQYKSVSGNAPSIILKSVTKALIVVGQYVYGAFNGNRLMVAIISGGDYNDGNEHKNMTTIIKGNEFDAEVGFSFSISTNGVGEITLSASTNPVFIGVLILG